MQVTQAIRVIWVIQVTQVIQVIKVIQVTRKTSASWVDLRVILSWITIHHASEVLAYLEFDGLSYNHSSSQCTSPDVMDQNHIRCDSDQFWPSSFSEIIQNITKRSWDEKYIQICHMPFNKTPFPIYFWYLGKGLGVENLFALRNSISVLF